jgi:hypothetical protein
MSEIIKIGLDAEFMAYKGSKVIYPIMPEGLKTGVRQFGCDEFGHCVEARPKEADNANELITNVMKAMERLPEGLKYVPENVHSMEKSDYFKLLREQGSKQLSGCKNIHKQDILDDCPAELKARELGRRLTFCGMHLHVSKVLRHQESYEKEDKTIGTRYVELPVNLPIKTLVWLFDICLFSPLSSDANFAIGRYRSPGFYETKGGNHHFEYRSLGVSAFTPERLYIIFEIAQELIKNVDDYTILGLQKTDGKVIKDTESKLYKLVNRLLKTKPTAKCLRKLWVPWK